MVSIDSVVAAPSTLSAIIISNDKDAAGDEGAGGAVETSAAAINRKQSKSRALKELCSSMKDSMPGFVKNLEQSFHRRSEARRKHRAEKKQSRQQEPRKLTREDSTSSISSHASSFASGWSLTSSHSGSDSIFGQSFVFSTQQGEKYTEEQHDLDDDCSISSRRFFASSNSELYSYDNTSREPMALLPEEIHTAISESWAMLYERDGIEHELGVRVVRNIVKFINKAGTEDEQQQAQLLQEILDREEESNLSLDESDRLSLICNVIVEFVDMIVTVFWGYTTNDEKGDIMDDYQAKIVQMGHTFHAKGLNPRFLKEGILRAVHSLAKKHHFTDITKDAWDTALATVIDRMI